MVTEPTDQVRAGESSEAIERFRQRFRAALQKTRAEVFEHSPHLWPRGPLARLQVAPPSGSSIPGQLDPVGLVWYAETGDYRGVLDGATIAGRLGLSERDASDVLNAADRDDGSAWRAMLTEELSRVPKWTAPPAKITRRQILRWSAIAGSLILAAVLVQRAGWLRAGPFPTPEFDLLRRSYSACQDFVLQQVDTPSTAEFAGRFSRDTRIASEAVPEGTRFRVSSFLDLQNEFGATVRARFDCTVTWGDATRSGQRHWTLTELHRTPWAAGAPGDVRR